MLAEFMLRVGEFPELSLLAKATVIVGVALMMTRLINGLRASLAHAIMTSAFGILLALPLVRLALPEMRIEVSVPRYLPVSVPAARQSIDTPDQPIGPARLSSSGLDHRRVPVTGLLWVVWAAGTGLFFTQVAFALRHLREVRTTGLPCLEIQCLVRTLAIEAGLKRPVDLLLHEHVHVPATYGLRSPAIVLPIDAPSWSKSDLQHALKHELEHLRRCDWATQLLARAVCGMYWFHPLVWVAWRDLVLHAERACDDAVLEQADGPSYAAQLVKLARRLSNDSRHPTMAMASRRDLAARVSAILDKRQRRGRVGAPGIWAIASGATALALAVSPLKAVGVQQSPQAMATRVGMVRPSSPL